MMPKATKIVSAAFVIYGVGMIVGSWAGSFYGLWVGLGFVLSQVITLTLMKVWIYRDRK